MNSIRWKRAGLIFLCCLVLILFIDIFLNARFVTWFYNSFMVDYGDGAIEPDWQKLKLLMTLCCLIGVPGSYLLFYYLLDKHTKQERQQIKQEMLVLLHEDPVKSPHSEYAEIEIEILKLRMERQVQKDLYEKEAARKNDLITYLAHDLKTPLASVIGYLSFLEEAGELPYEQREKYIRIALDKAYHLEDLIDQFFDITRFNIQTIVLNRENADLSFLMQQLEEAFYPIAKQQNRSLSFHIPDELTISLDPDKFGRVLNNVMKNAIAYSKEGSTITVQESQRDEMLYIEICNEGSQIPPQKLQMIFEKFYRMDHARSTRQGAGLGLAIAKEIMKAHDGDIQAKSDPLHTTFTISLPLYPYDKKEMNG